MRRSSVERAADGQAAALQDVGVDHGGLDVLVAEELLDRADVVVVLQQVGGEGVAEGVAGHALVEAGGTWRLTDSALQAAFVEVMAPRLAGAGVSRELRGGEDVLPDPFAGRVATWPSTARWVRNASISGPPISFGWRLPWNSMKRRTQST